MRIRAFAAVAAVAVGLAAVAPATAGGGRTFQASQKLGRVRLPYSTVIEVPTAADVVTATAKVGAGQRVSVELFNADTGRSRCKSPTYVSWNEEITGTNACKALTAVDPPGTKWKLTAAGNAPEAEITLTFESGRIPGPAAKLDLSQLSMPRYSATKTEDLMVPSFDGVDLHVQVTRPDVRGRVPAVLVSSPYYSGDLTYETPLVRDWVPRGYAIVTADVRGYNQSGGCVEVWGENEQKDQKALVEWIADQPWSNGRVGMIGKSYVGTTPLEAAVQAPKALDAVVVSAPVVSAYDDWHFGGVPNGENAGSPVSYQGLYGTEPAPGTSNPVLSLQNAANGLCDPTLVARANDPRAIYDSFYEERDFAARAEKIQAAVLYIHGYEDSNVKASVFRDFFNNLKSPHLGLFGHWDHIWAPRVDAEALYLGWMDQYLKDRPVGLERLGNALVLNDDGGERELEGWPTKTARPVSLYPDYGGGLLGPSHTPGDGRVLLESAGASEGTSLPTKITLTQNVKRPIELAGIASLKMRASLAGAENGYVSAWLYDTSGDKRSLITFGMANLAHRNGHDRYDPVTPTETIEMNLDFLITDHVFKRGHDIELEIRAARVMDWLAVAPSEPGVLTFHGGADGTQLVLPTLPVGTAKRSGPAPAWN